MITVRFGTVMAPLIGGLIIATSGVSWNYLVAGLGTLGTLIPLVHLPTLRPEPAPPQHPLRAMLGGISSLWSAQDVVGDSGGALMMGALGRLFTPLLGAVCFGLGGLGAALLMLAGFGRLRALRAHPPPATDPETLCAEQGA